ncbi:peptidylprolyl isomerase [Catelliglobosispora koreensis]|uniref:peptidylprolyl isomerase n=1 Tax=Catelliglobosispora koreensis TaxID=129052 RepID=UPI00036E2BFF|nr:peptidylprolyl isomerase [Catelliglobosispora koreensis]
MSSTIQRERAAARARLERQMAEKLEKARQRRQRGVIAGAAAAVVLVAGGIIWAVAAGGDEKPADTATGDSGCVWTPEDLTANPDLKDTGTPPAGVPPKKGTQTMTIDMNIGVVEVEVATAAAPCTARSMSYLASKNYFDNTKCHRLVTEGIKVLQCGDPAGKGTGGPSYKMAEENLPNYTEYEKNYPEGTIAMAKTQQPNSTGSQFFIVWGATPLPGDYTILGKITKGLDLIKAVGAAGAKPADESGTTAPNTEVLIKTIRVTEPQA